MGTQELRKEERFPAALLPAKFRTFGILINQDEATATLIDASYSGFGFQIGLPVASFSLGSSLVIYPEGTSKALYGTVMHLKAVDAHTSRVGVKLKEVGQYREYQAELSALLELISDKRTGP